MPRLPEAETRSATVFVPDIEFVFIMASRITLMVFAAIMRQM
jgi:hypothetical protein